MCGIAGYVLRADSKCAVSPEALDAMTDALRHRGPDDRGVHRAPHVGLGSRRLSIVDLSPAGRMPLTNEDGSVVVVQNGEIYNYGALRGALLARGHAFAGASDTEVIAHLYEERGADCVAALDGMFAIALWDETRRQLLLARDRFGEKPLYYQLFAGGIAFASEIKALARFPYFDATADHEALVEFLSLGYFVAPGTPYREVRKLLPGHLLVYGQADGRCRVAPFWQHPAAAPAADPGSEAEPVQRLRAELWESVRSRLVGDVPIAAFLSGGVDSTLVVAAMAEQHAGPVDTFSIGYRFSTAHDENRQAAAVADMLGVRHHTMWVEAREVLAALDELPQLWDEPLGDPALLSVFLITRYARANGFKVMLSGDGGDELFWGYPLYSQAPWLQSAFRLPMVARRMLAVAGTQAGRWRRSSRLAKAAHLLREPDLARAARYVFSNGAWSSHELQALRGGRPPSDLPARFAASLRADPGSLQRGIAGALLAVYLPDNNLARMDRASMANGVETRAPFLHPDLAALSAGLPPRLKLQRGTTKVLPRRLLAEVCGPRIAARPKHGFNALPMADWLRGELAFLLDEYLSPGALRPAGLLDAGVVQRTVAEHKRGGQYNHWWKLWLLVALQLWIRAWKPRL